MRARGGGGGSGHVLAMADPRVFLFRVGESLRVNRNGLRPSIGDSSGSAIMGLPYCATAMLIGALLVCSLLAHSSYDWAGLTADI